MEKIIYQGVTYNSLKEFFLKNKKIIPYKSLAPIKKRIDQGEALQEIILQGKNKPGKTKGPYIVEEITYRDLPSIAKEYGLSERSIYKRYSRGKRGDDLVPEKKRKHYVKPKKQYKIYINGIGYNSKAEACRKNNVKYITYRKRIIWGWTELEALGIKQRKNIPSTSLESKNYHGKKRVAGKKIILLDKTFSSIAEASRFYNKDTEAVTALMRSGRSAEEALGLKTIMTKDSFTYKGKKYKNLADLSKKINFPYGLLATRTKDRGMSIDEAIALGSKKIGNKGRYNKTILNRDPDLASSPASLYFISIIIDNKTRYKIGITTRNIKKRMDGEGYKFRTIKSCNSNLMKCFLLEQKILKKYSAYKDHEMNAKYLDGHTEIFNFPDKIIEEINKLISMKD